MQISLCRSWSMLAGVVVVGQLGTALAGGWLGVSLLPPQGVQVGEVVKDSPADQAGLARGDVIVKSNGEAVRALSQFTRQVSLAPPGTEIKLTVARDGKTREVPVKLGENQDALAHGPGVTGGEPGAPPGIGQPWNSGAPGLSSPMGSGGHAGGWHNPQQGNAMGMNPQWGGQGNAMGMNPQWGGQGGAMGMPRHWSGHHQGGATEMRPQWNDQGGPMMGGESAASGAWLGVAVQPAEGGIAVSSVAPDSPAKQAGLQPGDVITGVNKLAVTRPGMLVSLIASQQPGNRIGLSLLRNGQAVNLDVTLANRPVQQSGGTGPANPAKEQPKG